MRFRMSTLIYIMIGVAPAHASESSGRVRDIVVRQSDGLHFVVLSADPVGRPACAASHAYYMIANEASDVGKAQFALLMSAYFADRPVRIVGTGQCTRWGDGEDIDIVTLAAQP